MVSSSAGWMPCMNSLKRQSGKFWRIWQCLLLIGRNEDHFATWAIFENQFLLTASCGHERGKMLIG
jgi:hypothetical protein